MRDVPRIIVLILICLSFLCASSPIEPQEEEIVTAKTFLSRYGIHPGESFKVALLLSIPPGWHINGPKLDDEFLVPSELIIDESDNIKILKLHYPDAGVGRFDYSEDELSIYEGEILLGALIKASDDIALRKHILKASFLYQPCNDRACMPPRTLKLEIPFEAVPLSRETEEINKKIFSKIDFEK